MTRVVRLSPTLVVDEACKIVCARCGHALADAGGGSHWKHAAALTATPAAEQPGWSPSTHEALVLRQFSCPSCGSLLDCEVALPEDPFLYDVVHC